VIVRQQGKAATARDDLRMRITAGEYQPGDQLPRVRELLATYGIRSRSGIDEALNTLEAEGLIERQHGSKIFVRRRHVVRRDLVAGLQLEYRHAVSGEPAKTGLFEAITGEDDVEVSITYQQVAAGKRVGELLKVDPAAPVLARTFHYKVTGKPHQVARSFMPAATAAAAGLVGPESERLGIGTIAQLRAAGCLVDRARLTIDSRMPTAAEARELEIPPGTPVYEHWRVMIARDAPVEVSTAVVAANGIQYFLDVTLAGGQR
jgi:GntR family transcriptional regulator